jgi:hypothetical protein
VVERPRIAIVALPRYKERYVRKVGQQANAEKAAKSIKEKRLAKKIKKVDGTNPETSK